MKKSERFQIAKAGDSVKSGREPQERPELIRKPVITGDRLHSIAHCRPLSRASHSLPYFLGLTPQALRCRLLSQAENLVNNSRQVVAVGRREVRFRGTAPNHRSGPSQSHPTGSHPGMHHPDLCWCISDSRCTGKGRLRSGQTEDGLRPGPRTCRLQLDSIRHRLESLSSRCSSR